MVLIYVDDMIITGNRSTGISLFMKDLKCAFAIKDLGPLHYFLGIEVRRINNDLYLTQTKYVIDLLSRGKNGGLQTYQFSNGCRHKVILTLR